MASNGKSDRGESTRPKAGKAEIAEQVAWESERRARLAVPAIAGGVLYLLSGIIISSTLNGAPNVGVLQGIAPALKGIADPTESPRAAEVRFVSHHAFALIAGSALMALALVALTGILLLLVKASKFRRPESWPATAPLVIFGGIGFALISLGHQIATAILSHEFTTGTDFSNSAVDHVLTSGTVNVVAQYISLIAGLALAVGMVVASLNAMRTGLLTRWMGIVGVLAALLIFLPIGGATLELIPAFWMAAAGLLFMGRWPGAAGEPPAWAAGEARPWPSQAEMRAQQQAEAAGKSQARKGGKRRGASADSQDASRNGNGNGGDALPAPSSSRRRRKRRSRG